MWDVDLVDTLPTNSFGGPNWRYTAKRGAVVHYNGPAVPESFSDRAWIDRVVSWHLQRNWSNTPGGPMIYGDGIMYHLVVGRDGTIYRTRRLADVLWHCGSWPENQTHVSVYFVLGGNQRATDVQLARGVLLLHELRRQFGFGREAVIGHQEVDWTDCPGTLQGDLVLPYRREGFMTTDQGRFFAETGHYIGGGFWQYWIHNGGLMIFGYPLTDEMQEDGRTVQYFERAVFEWHPENEERFRVLLRRLGAEALSRTTNLTKSGV